MTKSSSALSTFFRELRRRKVFQVAVVYAVVGWLIIQVVETIFPALHLPAWTVTFIVVLLIIGFPIALILAWAFELTPEGVRRTVVVDRERLMEAAYPYQKEFKEVDRPMNVYDPAVEGLSSGKTISNYKIIEKIGEGGMGVVFKARDLKLDRTVALKFLPQGVFADDKERARFLQEARAASALNHPNVCIIHDLQEHQGQQFIVMEHVEGVTLREKVRESPLPVEDVLSYATQIGEALQEAHAKGIIHRDVKSDNIMVTHRNEIKVMDFGLAKLKGAYRQTRRTSTVGTLAYMSPEHIKGEEVDGRMDIFSFGVVFYEMLTGRLPFYGDNQAALLYSILNREPEPLTRYRPGLSSGFLHMVDRSLEKDPADRFQSMKGVLIELRRLKRDTSKVSLETPTEPPAYAPPAARPGARAWRFVGGVALIACLVAAGAYFLWQRTRAPALPQFTNPRQVTTALGVEDYPTWSPEGGRLAYQSDQSGNWDIWVTQTGGGPPLNLTEDYEGGDRCPSWSPDGSQIAFQSGREGGGYFVMPALGGSPRKVAASSWIGYATPPQWSADGSELACVVIDSAQFFVEIVSLERATSRRMQLTGKEKEYIRVWEMSWSGDGRHIAFGTAFDRGSPTSQVLVMRLSDGKDFPVTDVGTLNLSPSWSRDGRYLYFVSNRGGSKDLWQQQLDDDCTPVGPPQRLTVGQEMWFARFSPDGEKLAFSKGRSMSNLWRVPILEERPSTWADASQLTFGQATLSNLDLSPDGAQLVFASTWEGKRHAFLLPVQGGEPRRLTMAPMNQILPAWSPDGREIAYHSDEGGNRNIWVVSVEGGAPRQVTRSEFWDLSPAWSPDGREIAFVSTRSGNWDIWVIPAEGGEARQMTHHPADDWRPLWSPDGKWLYFWSDRTGEEQRWRVPAAGGAPELVTGALALGGWLTPKSPDWKKIYLERDGNIREVTVESGAERQLTDFTGKYGSFGSQATDGKYFYFVWSENTGDLWVMDVIRDE